MSPSIFLLFSLPTLFSFLPETPSLLPSLADEDEDDECLSTSPSPSSRQEKPRKRPREPPIFVGRKKI